MKVQIIFLAILAVCCFACFFTGSAVAEKGNFPEVMFILDGSGSMWGMAGEQRKIDAAKEVLASIVPELPAEVRLGLTAYGHRRKGDCRDVEILIPPGSKDRQVLLEAVTSITPKGKTPIAASLEMVVDRLRTQENETTIILISDGVETCHDDPCGLVQKLKESGIKFVLHVVGFDVDDNALKQLKCLAEAGEGQFFVASDTASLLSALQTVNKVVEEKVKKAKTKTVKKSTGLGKISLQLIEGTEKSLSGMQIVRTSDEKVLKETEDVDGVHLLPAGEYTVVLLFANPNYRDPDPVTLGTYDVIGGETTSIPLGALAINIPDSLTKAIDGVILVDEKQGNTWLKHHNSDNNYYMFKPRPVPQGTYGLQFIYMKNEQPVPIASGLQVDSGKRTTVTLNAGVQLEEADGIQAWELVDSESGESVLRVQRSWDNDFPLWYAFPVQPGTYNLQVEIEGMTEPLPVGQGLEIKEGETAVFSVGL